MSVPSVFFSSSSVRRSQGIAGAAIAVMLLVSACGGSTATESTSPEDRADLSELSSPLASFLGVDFASEDQQDVYLARDRQVNAWVQECMAGQGFEYHAIDPSTWDTAYDPDPDAPDWGTKEWTELYGFGVSTQTFDQRTVGPELIGSDSSSPVTVDDPNDEYLASLSEEEVTAYYAALYGNSSYDWDPSLSDEENSAAADKYFQDLVPTGCQDMAHQEFQSADPWSAMYSTFGSELDQMYERVYADPEITRALDEVSRCVGGKGFNFVDAEQFNEELYVRIEPIYAEMTWPGDGLTEQEWGSMTEDEQSEFENSAPIMSEQGKAVLAELQAFELEVALAAFDCGNADMEELYMQVGRRYEQEFVDAHRAELEALKTS